MNKRIKSGADYASKTLVLALLAGTAMPAIAMAQARDESTTVSPVVITAERREENLQETSISATVLSGDEIQQKGVDSINDVQQIAPSIAINAYNRSTFINIRGVGIAQSAPTSNPGVAYYIDGILVPHEQFIGQSFFDIGSIEVLRGPQGTLTGQNSTGGAVYVTTPAPVYGADFGLIDLTAGDYGHYRGMGVVNFGLSEHVAARLAVVHDERDSFTTNIGPSPSQPGNSKLDALRLNIAAHTEDDSLTGNFIFEGFDLRTDNNAVKRRGDTISTDPFVIEEDAISFMNQKGYRASGEVNADVTDGLRLRTIVSWQNGYTKDQTDGDRTDYEPPWLPKTNVGRVSNAVTNFETFTGEVNLLTTDDKPLQWVAGLFELNEFVPVVLLRDNYHTDTVHSSNSTIDAVAHNLSQSAFGQINFRPNQNWEVIAGLRQSQDWQTYTRYAIPGPPPAGGYPVVDVASSQETTGRLGLNYFTNDGSLLYGTVSKGYKAGGVNLSAGGGNFGPETNIVYEAGFKTELMNHQLRINGDIFHSDYSDIQLSSLLGGLPVTQNAASGKADGAEFEVTGRFGPLGLNAGVGYLKAKFGADTCITDTNASGTDAGCPTGLRFVPQGRVLPFSPEWTLNAGIQYDFTAGDMFITPRLQWSYISEQNATPFPSTDTIVPERSVFDFRLTADINESTLAEFFVENLTDETYIASQIQSSSSATGGAIYGAPRTYGVRLVKRFGEMR